jgi:RimJ/RimL family protein N-acetyltransferase
VKLSGEVQQEGLSARICKASVLLFLTGEQHQLCGISAIKRPAHNYRDRVFAKAKASVRPEDFKIELGWVFLRQEYRGRGLGASLVSGIIAHATGSIYATTRSDNTPMQQLLKQNGFTNEGSPYHGADKQKTLLLFVKSPSLRK